MWNTAIPTYMPVTDDYSSTRLEFEDWLTTERIKRWLAVLGDTKDNQFCLEQDDDMDTAESDNSLPEFLDTFEVKGGD